MSWGTSMATSNAEVHLFLMLLQLPGPTILSSQKSGTGTLHQACNRPYCKSLLAQHMFSLLGAGHFAGPCWIYISLLSSKSFSPGVSYQRIFQECLPRVSSQECPPRVSVQERLTKASFKSIVFSSSGSVFQECLWRMSHKSVFQECLPRVSKQECLPRASSTIVCFHLFPNPAWQHLTTYWC